MSHNIFGLFLQAEKLENLIVPDSVQKEKFAQTVKRLAALDVNDIVSDIVSWLIWTGIKICIALAIYYAGRWFIKRIVNMIDAIMTRRRTELSLHTFLLTLVRTIGYIILVVAVVSVLGINLTIFAAVLASAGLAIGMALSSTLQNFAGGVMILVMKPYRVGDFISAQGQSGTVREIKLFSTVITTGDNQTIYIPNNAIATAIIDNYSTADLRRVDWTIGISYGDDVDAARKALLEILASDTRILAQPAPVVWVAELADSAVNLTVRAWTRNADYWDVFFQNNERFYKRLPEHGINFPFPQVDLHLKQE